MLIIDGDRFGCSELCMNYVDWRRSHSFEFQSESFHLLRGRDVAARESANTAAGRLANPKPAESSSEP